MFVKVEPTGCVERKGLVQIRFAMYLDETDYNYEKHHIQVPERPLIEEELADLKLAKLVPLVWQLNPFHNHFIYVESETADKVIMDIGEAYLHEAYIKWSSNEELDLKNPLVQFHESVDDDKLQAIQAKVLHLKEIALVRQV